MAGRMRRTGFLPAAFLTATLLLLAAGGIAPADEVVLSDGSRVAGRVVTVDEKGVVVERTGDTGTNRLWFPRADVRSITFSEGPAAGEPAAPAPEGRPVRDEWWLLESDGRVVGTRHLLLLPKKAGDDVDSRIVWRLEEQVTLFGSVKAPGVRVQRIEDVDAEFRPRFLHYREVGEAGPVDSGITPYEVIRSGPVADGEWAPTERPAPKTALRLSVPEGAIGPLGLREVVARKSPRRAEMGEYRLLDAGRGAVRTVRSGFTVVSAANGAKREDTLRVEDGERVLESRWTTESPPRAVWEEVAPGVTAKPSTRARVEAAEAQQQKPAAAPVDPTAPTVPGIGPVEPPPAAPPKPKTIAVLDAGFEIPVPGASWTTETPPSTDAPGRRVVAKLWSSSLAAEIRVEWEPMDAAAARPTPAEAEERLLARLRALSSDLGAVEARSAVPAIPGAWRMTLSGTLNGERVRTLLLVAERRSGFATVIATCPEAAWNDAKDALEGALKGFRWL